MKNKDKPIHSLKDMSRMTGFHQSTISRVLNGLGEQYRISKATQQKVLAFAKKVDFSFDENARSLRLRKTHIIGLVVPDISNSFFSKIALLLEREANKRNYSILLCNSDNQLDSERNTLQLLKNRQVDGIVLFPIGLRSSHIQSIAVHTPVILIDRYFPKTKLSFVTSDNFGGAMSGVKHLLDLGHKKIACVQGLPKTLINTERVGAYKNALFSNKIKFEKEWLVGTNFTQESGYDSAKKLFSLPKKIRPTAIFSVSNITTLGILQYLQEQGLLVGKDISLISFDEEPYDALLTPPLTVIAQNEKAIGEMAIKLILEEIESKTAIQKKMFIPTYLQIRKSVRDLRKNKG